MPNPNCVVGAIPCACLNNVQLLFTREQLGRCRSLTVAGPWHSPAMAQARREFEAWLGPVKFRVPQVPLLFNVTAAAGNRSPEKFRQLSHGTWFEPVRWRSCMEQLRAAGATTLFEIGPGRVLSGPGAGKRFRRRNRVGNVNNLRGVDLAASAAQ